MSVLTVSMDSVMEKVKLVKVEKFLVVFELVPALKYSAIGQAFCWFLHAIFVSVGCATGKDGNFVITQNIKPLSSKV